MSKNTAIEPPHNLDAELSVLGAMMLSKNTISNVSDLLDESDFYRHTNGHIFRAMVELDASGAEVDAITTAAALERQPGSGSFANLLEQVGGRPHIHTIAALVPATSNAPHYARLVRDAARLRGLIFAGQNIARLGYEGNGDVAELIAQAEEHLTTVTIGAQEHEAHRLHDLVTRNRHEIDSLLAADRFRYGIKTGFSDLDRLTTGLYPGQVVIIAARPGMGKTNLGLNIAENIADGGTPVGIFALEMDKDELALRSLSRASGVDSQKLRTGRLKDADYQAYKNAQTLDRPVYVDDTAALTITDIRARAIRLVRRHGAGALVVDYLQLITPAGHTTNREQEVSAISRSLKILAKQLGVPIIAISQLSRALESRDNKRPFLSDLRESGSLEQDADLVIFIYRDDYYNADSDAKGVAEIIVAKQRMGPNATINLGYSGRKSSFLNLPQKGPGAPPLPR